METPVEKLPQEYKAKWQWIAAKALENRHPEPVRVANAVIKKAYDDFEVEADDDAFTSQAEKDYQYVDSWEYESRKVSQEEANYNAAGGKTDKACSNCFFFVSPARCTAVQGTIAPNGLSSLWRAVPAYEPTPIPVVVVGLEGKQADQTLVDATVGPRKLNLLQAALSSLGVKQDLTQEGMGTAFKVVKQADGSLRWFSRFTNNFQDRDDETILEAAHKEYVSWVDSTGFYPELWLWHTVGTKFGKADWLDYVDGFACASGTVDDTPAAKAAVAFLGTQEIGVSHGFLQVKEGNLITKYRTFEISPLPLKRAAAWSTNFGLIGKETLMTFTKDKREFLVGALGEDAVKKLEDGTETAAKQLKDLGFTFKSVEPPVEAPPSLVPDASVAPVAAAAVASQQAETFTAGLKQLTELHTDLMGAVSTLTGQVATITEQVKELKKSDDDKIADAFAAKVSAVAGVRPTELPSNVQTKEVAAADAGPDFFNTEILKGFGQVAGGAAAVPGAPAVGAVTVS